MGKLSAFQFITLNGFLEGENGDISWHNHGVEENEFAAENLKNGNILLFGRLTYQMMAGYWPTPMAMQNTPEVAEGMNKAEKIVFSRTLETADWQNTSVVKDHIVNEIERLKHISAKDMTLMGSGSILTQFAEHGLIDELEVMIDPVVIGNGTSIFKGIEGKMNLQLRSTRTFKSGVVLLSYRTGKNL